MKRFSIFLAGVALPGLAHAGLTEQIEAHQRIGCAKAAVEACQRLKLNPKGMLEIIKKLDAGDQAAVASNQGMTDYQQKGSMELLKLMGDVACDAALDFEEKLGIDIFMDKWVAIDGEEIYID